MTEQIFTTVSAAIETAWRFLQTIRLADIVDILIIAYLIYKLLGLIRVTRTGQLARGIVFVFVALWGSSFFELNVVNFLLNRAVELGLLSLVIIFQPELRRALERLGSGVVIPNNAQPRELESTITHLVTAFTDFSNEHVGALVVFERKTILDDVVKTGVVLDASVTSDLLKNIFYPKAPMHDGAAIIREGRVIGAGCMLPMSGNANLSRDLGMRHRAGIGMSEHSDAVIAIVSEESGSISVAMDGMLKRHLAPETLERLLRNELLPAKAEESRRSVGSIWRGVQNLLKREKETGNDAR